MNRKDSIKGSSKTDMEVYVDTLDRTLKGNIDESSVEDVISLYSDSIDSLTEANIAVNMWSNRAFNNLTKTRTSMRSSRNIGTKLDSLGDMIIQSAGLTLICIAVSGKDSGGGLTGLSKLWNIIKGGRKR